MKINSPVKAREKHNIMQMSEGAAFFMTTVTCALMRDQRQPLFQNR